MKRLITLAAVAAALMTSACVTVIDATGDEAWHSENAERFDTAKADCRERGGEQSTAFITCMADKGWTRS